MDLELLKLYAISLIGTPYFYGGDDAVGGFDCSGLASELSRASGLEAWNFRMNAQQIFDRWKTRYRSAGPVPQLGDFAFYGTGENTIEHIAFCVNGATIIEAGGGDSATINPADAIQKNAFTRMRLLNYRRNLFAVLRPIYPVYLSPPKGIGS